MASAKYTYTDFWVGYIRTQHEDNSYFPQKLKNSERWDWLCLES